MSYKDMSDKELIDEHAGYQQLIGTIGCYGTKDLMRRDAIEVELYDRGYEPTTIIKWWKEGMPPAEEEEKEDYETAFNILMEYFDFIPEEERHDVDRRLKEIGV